MNTIEHFRQSFAYNDWANQRILAALKENAVERARQILAHLLITEKEYFERLFGKDSTASTSGRICRSMAAANSRAKPPEFTQSSYRNLKRMVCSA